MEWSGTDHFSVAVEFEQADTAGHHQARKEVQVLSIDPENNFEEFEITISGATGDGTFKVQFINPLYNPDNDDSSPFWMSDEIPDDTTADNLRNRISGYFSSIWGSNINVVKVDYDADALETTDADLTVQSIYTVTLRKLISQNSFTSAAIVPVSGDATVEIGMQTVTSSTPLSGKFKVVCPDENLNEFSTTDMNYDNWVEGIDFNIQL